MAQLSTPEENARKILNIFVNHFKSQPGNVLRLNNFIAVIQDFDLSASDFNTGLEFAFAQGWVELPSTDSYRLTQAGFEAA